MKFLILRWFLYDAIDEYNLEKKSEKYNVSDEEITSYLPGGFLRPATVFTLANSYGKRSTESLIIQN